MRRDAAAVSIAKLSLAPFLGAHHRLRPVCSPPGSSFSEEGARICFPWRFVALFGCYCGYACGIRCEHMRTVIEQESLVRTKTLMPAILEMPPFGARRAVPALNRVNKALEASKTTQLRDGVLPRFATVVLREIRENFCAQEAVVKSGCAKWMVSTEPVPWKAIDAVNHMKSSTFVCGACKHPLVTVEQVILKLGLHNINPKFSDRTLRRYLNDGHKVPTDLFRMAVVKAFALGILDGAKLKKILEETDENAAALLALRKLRLRAIQQLGYKTNGRFDISLNGLVDAYNEQWWVIQRKWIDEIRLSMHTRGLTSELKEILLDVIMQKEHCLHVEYFLAEGASEVKEKYAGKNFCPDFNAPLLNYDGAISSNTKS